MKRLFDDPAFSPELRAELARSQRAGREYDVEAKLQQLREALANPQPTGTELLEQGGSQIQLMFAAKVVVVAAVVAVIGYVAWPQRSVHIQRRSQPAAAARPLDARAQQPPARPSAPPPTASVAAPEPKDDLALDQPPPPSAVAATPAAPARPAERSSRREIAQLVRIRALLERDPKAAYQLAQRSEQEFPKGVLSEERQALLVEALAKSGRLEAAAQKAKEFHQRYPQSPLRDRVEAALRH
jgi:hypothetical protein